MWGAAKGPARVGGGAECGDPARARVAGFMLTPNGPASHAGWCRGPGMEGASAMSMSGRQAEVHTVWRATAQ